MENERKPWQEFFMSIADLVSKQSTCLRRHVGAVIVRDTVPLSIGYNGSPSGLPHCEETGCLREKLNIPSGQRHELCRGAHAEQNAINNAAKNGINILNTELYCTTFPCSMCAKSIINSGIRTVYYRDGYPDKMTNEMFEDANVKIINLSSD
jgi:dCMP deaminase